jgi:glycine/D-amino acid oxidase-like deaminating enzyme
MSDIAVIGAGLIGSAVAYYCSLAGARVTVIEAVRPGGGTSSTSFSWLNANNKLPREYFDLNVAGMREHVALREQLGSAPWLHDGGNFEWADSTESAALVEKIERLRSWGCAVEAITPRQARGLEPDLVIDDGTVDCVAYYPADRWLDPLPLIHALLRESERRGARLRRGRVTRLDLMAGRVVAAATEAGDRVEADVVVDCAGRVANDVAALAGFALPMANTAGLLAVTAPAPTGLSRIVHAPEVNIRPDGAGRLLLASDDTDAMVDTHTSASMSHPGCVELLRRATEVLPALDRVPLEAARLGVRPIPADGLSAVGPIPGIEGAYLAVTHSGATLCLAIGRRVASELVEGKQVADLAAFRPARFASKSSQRTVQN